MGFADVYLPIIVKESACLFSHRLTTDDEVKQKFMWVWPLWLEEK
jgi:hypothetical protein